MLVDRGDGVGAMPAAQMAELAGHPQVAILLGGMAAWQGELAEGPVELEPVREASLRAEPARLPDAAGARGAARRSVADDPRRPPRRGVHGQGAATRAIRGRATSPARSASRSSELFAGRAGRSRRSRSASSSARPRAPRSSRTATPARALRSRRSRCAAPATTRATTPARGTSGAATPSSRSSASSIRGARERALGRVEERAAERAPELVPAADPFAASPRAAVRGSGGGSLLSSIQPSSCASVTSGWNCTPQHASPSRNACVQAALRASSTAPAGKLVRVVVPLERLERARAARRGRGRRRRPRSARPRASRSRASGSRPTHAPAARASSCDAEADAEHRRAPVEQPAGATSTPRAATGGARPGRRASRRRRRAPRRTSRAAAAAACPTRSSTRRARARRRRRPARRAPRAHPLPWMTERTSTCRLYAPPVAGILFTSSSRRSWRAFAAACETRPSGLSGSSRRSSCC